MSDICVVKRNGTKQKVSTDKIKFRILKLAYGLNRIQVDDIVNYVVNQIRNNIHTSELDLIAAKYCAIKIIDHPQYGLLAGRIAVDNLHKNTNKSFTETFLLCSKLLDKKIVEFVANNKNTLDSMIVHSRDFLLNYISFCTLETSYLLKNELKQVLERPQYMYLRTAIQIHYPDLEKIHETYELLSNQYFIHATPTLYNSCFKNNQLASCFLLQIPEDSIESIYNTLGKCAQISKGAGGIGLSIHNVRSKNSPIVGTNGFSNGIIPMCQVYNSTARYVDQGGGKRNGSFAIYLEPWHKDILDFLKSKSPIGEKESKLRDLFLGLWVPDLFMKRVKEDKMWTLFSPSDAKGLNLVYGKEFEELYEHYEASISKEHKTEISATQLWREILSVQLESGMPYILYKDACNEKSNQKNLGTIQSSNLCTEIIQYTSKDEIAVCNLASISLPAFVSSDKKTFDFKKFAEVVKVATNNLNQVIDRTYYPVEEAKNSNLKHRPIGLGVQGLADCFIKLGLVFDSKEAKELNKRIFEELYYAALDKSCELAELSGTTYHSYENSPIAKGLLQQDLWGRSSEETKDWSSLRKRIAKFGVKNSLLVAPMPTASTSNILGNVESFEPISAVLMRKILKSGEYIVGAPELVEKLEELNIWNETLKNKIINGDGSIQHIKEIPDEIKKLYLNVWEISGKSIIEMSADRGIYIDQSQSLNFFCKNSTMSELNSWLFYGWEKGLKTGMYYCRQKSKAEISKTKLMAQEEEVCSINNPNCETCSS